MSNDTISLRHKDWGTCLPLFSPEAVVTVLETDASAIPFHIDRTPVLKFGWPSPASLYQVQVHEPEHDKFISRAMAAGVDLASIQLPGAGVVEDQSVSTWPGSVTPHSCPECKKEKLRISDILTALEFARSYTEAVQGSLRWEECQNHGIHIWINGFTAAMLECTHCHEHYIVSEMFESSMALIRRDQ